VLAVEDLVEGDVVGAVDSRSGAHRGAEARGGRLEAVDGDDEGVLTPARVVGVDVVAAHEHTVLDGDRRELASADADQGQWQLSLGDFLRLESLAVATGAPQPQPRRSRNCFQECGPTA